MLDPRKTLVNSNYQTDQVIKVFEGQFTADGSVNYPIIKHGLGFTPLMGGFWSETADFANSHAFSALVSVPNNAAEKSVFLAADTENIYFEAYDAGTYYYKIYALVPSGLDIKIETPDLAEFKTRTLDSNYNYMKLLETGKIELDINEQKIIEHGLGYLPTVRVWYNFPEVDSKMRLLNSQAQVEVGEDRVVFKNPAGFYSQKVKYQYRIYIDEA